MKFKNKKSINLQKDKAFALIEQGNYRLAEKILLNLLNEYPDDFYINYNMGLLYMCIHNYEMALPYFKKGGDNIKNVVRLAICYLFLNMENELFDLYQNVLKEKLDKTVDFSIFKYYLKCKYQDIEDFKKNDYYPSQVYNYSHDLALKHIKIRHYNTKVASCFNNDIDIECLFKKINYYIKKRPQDCFIYELIASGYFVFHYPDCGIEINPNNVSSTNIPCDYILVIVDAYNLNILSMFPISNPRNKKVCYLENVLDENNYVLAKSGLDRFKDKYGKNI